MQKIFHYQKITFFKTWLRTQFRFTVFDLTLAGILMGLGIIVTYISNLSLRGVLNVDFEIIFSIFFGIIFGPFKGVFLSVILDNLGLLLRGRIGFWMWEYAIVAFLIPIIAWGFFQILKLKKRIYMIIPISFIVLSLISVYGLFIGYGEIGSSFRFSGITQRFSYQSMLVILVVGSTLILIATYFISERYFSTKKNRYYQILTIISLTVFIQVIFRWIWGPFAFINYLNRFSSVQNDRSYSIYFPIYMIPIVLKSLITIPLFSTVLIVSIPTIMFLKAKYDNTFLNVLKAN
ncbi:uncharacterized protein DUF3816 [Mycoplasma testudineum]|uniref:Uncharacterized protein DUF3816 n=1 Tax=Mycoplasma testudineum TaxID=244584 RepID=A0A4R6IH54_9MOLU|nr:ECF transporter S component [Mycoplasma testudineum]OYD27065.1 hypothetical protein CG473_00220 [Mycoplasma testudineum]TDO21181.1 uncharacterized protein DUF3816 [Mycoplasma testudineum]